MQRLTCVKCGRYCGRYRRKTAQTIELELYCAHCKGHTKFCVVSGNLQAGEFLPNAPRPLKRSLSAQ